MAAKLIDEAVLTLALFAKTPDEVDAVQEVSAVVSAALAASVRNVTRLNDLIEATSSVGENSADLDPG
jgi:hypothetical protein